MQPGHSLCFVYSSLSLARAVAAGAPLPLTQALDGTVASDGDPSVAPLSARELAGRGLLVALRPLHRLPGTARSLAALTLHGLEAPATLDDLTMLCLSLPRSLLFSLPHPSSAAFACGERGRPSSERDDLALLPADLVHALAPVAQAPESKREAKLDTAASHAPSGEAVVVPCSAVVKAFCLGRPSLRDQRSLSADVSVLDDDTPRDREVVKVLAAPAFRIALPPHLLASCPVFASPSAGAEFGAPALAPQSLDAYLELMAALRTSCRRDNLVPAANYSLLLLFRLL